MELLVTIDQFDGPLNLLLYLVEKNQLELRKINLPQLTQLYLQYLKKMKDLNFDLLADFLHMATTLVFLRSEQKLFTDKKESAADDLIAQLEILKKYQDLGRKLWNLDKNYYEYYLHPPLSSKRKELQSELEGILPLDLLLESFIEFKAREKKVFKYVKLDEKNLEEVSQEILTQVQQESPLSFKDLKGSPVVLSFMAVLEMAKLKILHLYQGLKKEDPLYLESL